VTTPSDRSTPRRDFLGQLAASAIVLAGSACAAPTMAGQTTEAPTPAPRPATPTGPVHWDDTWFGKLTAKHKAVFDSPGIEDGMVLSHATGYISGMHDAIGAALADVQTVVVIRHAAIPMVFNDAMWAKYDFGKEDKIKDFSTDKWATRNPFFAPAPPKPNAVARPAPPSERPQANLQWLAAHQIVLGCDRATRGFAQQIAEKTKGQMQTVYEELKENLLPGVILQPTGVYAVHRAQEAGCTFIRST
jgi:hypothetical protein